MHKPWPTLKPNLAYKSVGWTPRILPASCLHHDQVSAPHRTVYFKETSKARLPGLLPPQLSRPSLCTWRTKEAPSGAELHAPLQSLMRMETHSLGRKLITPPLKTSLSPAAKIWMYLAQHCRLSECQSPGALSKSEWVEYSVWLQTCSISFHTKRWEMTDCYRLLSP